MASQGTPDLAGLVADRLRRDAEELVSAWIDELLSRSSHPAPRLPRRAIEDHIPKVLRTIADFVENPSPAAKSALLGDLEIHGRYRRDQGYDIRQLLDEFESLSTLLHDSVFDWLSDQQPAPGLDSIRQALERLDEACRSIAVATVGIYRESEMVHRKELSRHLEDFARAVSHELRNPLNAARLQASLLKRGTRKGGQSSSQRIETIEASIDRASELVDNIRILALAASSSAHGRHIELRSVVHSVIDEMTTAAQRRRVKVQLKEPLPPALVEAVPVQLALVNVLSNAIKYSDPDKAARHVQMSAQFSGENSDQSLARLEITVTDNGLGVPREFQQHVFRRHFRAHPTRAEGTGLGLAITRHVLLEHGGEITLNSDPGVGTEIRLQVPTLPIDSEFETATGGSPPPAEVNVRTSGDGEQRFEGRQQLDGTPDRQGTGDDVAHS